jgi:diaminohydroxyphosphoribosylaminopyrimidine deaminase / 5-amino-6-(5-phosphoribosylamino)uracil reductase
VQTSLTLSEIKHEWTNSEREFMKRALDLAALGAGLVSPGPLVGCVIVDPAGVIVGEGFYVFEEVKHAETLALTQAGQAARGGTAYVTLEPHAHHGRTPPCTDALITAGIRRVVSSIVDLNPKVSGKGFEHLSNAGVEVSTGLLAEEASKLNEAYLHHMRTGLPFVHLKMAVTLDGKIATRTGDSRWVAGPESRARAHELRHRYDAILVGSGTVAIDDPLLTDRSGGRRRRPLVRVVLDERLELSLESQLVKTVGDAPLVVFAGPGSDPSKISTLEERGVEIAVTDTRDLKAVLKQLEQRGIQSVLVEGGATVAGELIQSKLINKITFFIAPKIVGGRDALSAIGGEGVARMADALELQTFEITPRGRDIEVTGYPVVIPTESTA